MVNRLGARIRFPAPTVRAYAAWLVAFLLIALGVDSLAPTPANAFGTINGAGQKSEHERITKRALACDSNNRNDDNSCFDPISLDILAGYKGSVGAVGAPDTENTTNAAAHCDDADYLDQPGYPRTRAQASEKLIECVTHLKGRLDQALTASKDIVANGMVPDGSSVQCFGIATVASKCNTLKEFGGVLHGVQDFYAHSNYTDAADASQPISHVNPPGLGLSAPSPILNLIGPVVQPTAIPLHLTTGCFEFDLSTCVYRISHDTLNKDTGEIALPPLETIGEPTTERGKTEDNFKRAVEGAIEETREQWRDLNQRLLSYFGPLRGKAIACVITHDDPSECHIGPAGFGIQYKRSDGTYQPIGNYQYSGSIPLNDNRHYSLMGDAQEYASQDMAQSWPDFRVMHYVYASDFQWAQNRLESDKNLVLSFSGQSNNNPVFGPVYSNPSGYHCTQESAESSAGISFPGQSEDQPVAQRTYLCEAPNLP